MYVLAGAGHSPLRVYRSLHKKKARRSFGRLWNASSRANEWLAARYSFPPMYLTLEPIMPELISSPLRTRSPSCFPLHTARVQQQYDRWARVYDLIWQRYTDQTLAVLEAAAQIAPGEHVLDVGCGTGAFEARLVDMPVVGTPLAKPGRTGAGATLVGVDVSPKMLARARYKLRRAPNVVFHEGDAHALPFPDAHFDVVVSASTFHYHERPQVVLAEMRRVIRPGGRVVILDWCRDYATCRLMDMVLRRVDSAYRACYTQAELHTFLQEVGLSVRWSQQQRVGAVWGLMVVEAVPRL